LAQSEAGRGLSMHSTDLIDLTWKDLLAKKKELLSLRKQFSAGIKSKEKAKKSLELLTQLIDMESHILTKD
jgi:hypothetical protein